MARRTIGYGRSLLTQRNLAQRLHDVCFMADRFGMPDRRRTVEAYMAERDDPVEESTGSTAS